MDRFAKETSVYPRQFARLSLWPLEMMLQSQANLASATQSTLIALSKMTQCRSIGEAVAIQQQWLNGNIRRLGGAFDVSAPQGTGMSHQADPDNAAHVSQDSVKRPVQTERKGSAQRERVVAERAAPHTMRRDTRRGQGGEPSKHSQKKPGKQRKSRKR